MQQGRLFSRVVCSVCHGVSDTMDPFETLSLEMGEARSLTGLLALFTKSETLQGRDAYRCEGKCAKALVRTQHGSCVMPLLAGSLRDVVVSSAGQSRATADVSLFATNPCDTLETVRIWCWWRQRGLWLPQREQSRRLVQQQQQQQLWQRLRLWELRWLRQQQ